MKMENAGRLVMDWVYPPNGVPEINLGPLHDSVITAIESDPDGNTVSFTFSNVMLSYCMEPSDDFGLEFRFDGVQCVRVEGRVDEIRELNSPDSAIGREQSFANDAGGTTRVESVSWQDFERNVDEYNPSVLQAILLRNEERCAIRIISRTGSSFWPIITITAKALSISRSDGVPCDVEKLLAIGEAFWDS
jgi:hypothetical protein